MRRAPWLWILLTASLVRSQDPPPPPQPPTQEEKALVDEQVKEMMRRLERVVTIDVRNAKVDEIVERFRSQVGININVDMKNIPDDFRISEFVVKDMPFRQALDQFLRIAEMVIEDERPEGIVIGRPPRVTFNFRDADVRTVLALIAAQSGANVIFNSGGKTGVEGQVTISVNNVPWYEVLQAVVKTISFTTVRESFNVIRVIHPDELRKQMETKVFRLGYLQPPPLYRGMIKEDTATISGKPLQAPQQPSDIVKTFPLIQILETVLSKSVTGSEVYGRINFDWNTNSIVVTDVKPVLDRIEQILKILDVEPYQVIIDVKFISTTNEDLLSFGVNYVFGSDEGLTVKTRPLKPLSGLEANATSVSGKFTTLPFGLGHNNPHSSQRFLTNYEMEATFRAFKKDKFSKILQEPSLAALDNSEATIFVGEQIHYPEIVATTNQFGGLDFSIREAGKSPVNVGFQLFITPRILPDSNKVILTIIPSNRFLAGKNPTSVISGFERFDLLANGQTQRIDLPRISQQIVVTKLMLESGQSAVLGGLVIENTSYEDKKVPLLGEIPVLGYLFKSRSDAVTKQHLLIFITPRVTRSGRGAAEALEQMLKERKTEAPEKK